MTFSEKVLTTTDDENDLLLIHFTFSCFICNHEKGKAGLAIIALPHTLTYTVPVVPLLSLSDPANLICGLRLKHTRQRRIIGGENALR